MTLTLRYMRLPDVQQVASIDRVSFDPPWSARSYAYEISESSYSHMIVLEMGSRGDDKPINPWKRLFQNLNGGRDDEPIITAYGGIWNIVDEAHISTIAVHPDYRGRGWGELVLSGMLRKACVLKAAYVVLEVRVSNTTAQNLYKKHGFVIWGTKPRYYHNNGEDAYDMRLDLSTDDVRTRIETQHRALTERHAVADRFSAAPNPARSSRPNASA
ncbi:MAG: ribosomal protein S18-alanine N-acetyltransferase [bacterium]|nr:ribosomal protein S18-alanine N-acetyltransferase [bacterium]